MNHAQYSWSSDGEAPCSDRRAEAFVPKHNGWDVCEEDRCEAGAVTRRNVCDKCCYRVLVHRPSLDVSVHDVHSNFHINAGYSSHWSKPNRDGVKHMFACKVLVGEYRKGRINQPTPDVCQGSDLYDSTVNNVNTPSIFVVYNDAQAYPEYLITCAGASMQHNARTTTRRREHNKSITRASQEHHKSITRASQEHRKSITRASQEHHRSITTCTHVHVDR